MASTSDCPRHATHSHQSESHKPQRRHRSASPAQAAGTSAASLQERVEVDTGRASDSRGADPIPSNEPTHTIKSLEEIFLGKEIPQDILDEYMDGERRSDVEEINQDGRDSGSPEPRERNPKREHRHRRRRKAPIDDDGIYVNVSHDGTSTRTRTSHPIHTHAGIHVNSGNVSGQMYDGESRRTPNYTSHHGRSNYFDQDALSATMNQQFSCMNLFPGGIPGLTAGLGAGLNANLAASFEGGSNNVIIDSFNNVNNIIVDDTESEEEGDRRHARRGRKKASHKARSR